MILEPMVLFDLPEEQYFALDALSCSGAKRLLPPSCPALFQYEREHGRAGKPQYDLGHAAHKMVLGQGGEIHVIDATDYKKPANGKLRDELRESGRIPLLRKEFRQVVEMARAMKRHPDVGRLFDPEHGRAEVTFLWHDERWGIDRKARLDWLPNVVDGKVLIIPDYKTAASADPGSFARSAANYSYHMQDAWYSDAVRACLGVEAAFVFVAQEKDVPFLVTPFEYDPPSKAIGRAKNEAAMEIFRDCTDSGVWPTWSAGEIVSLSLPGWADRDYM